MAKVQDVAEQIFGWNPYKTETTQGGKSQALPSWAVRNHEIMQLSDLYQQQLAELIGAHEGLLSDQAALAEILAPFIDKATGNFIAAPDETALLLKKGLDLRLSEYEEDCRRLQVTERRLQRLIEGATLNFETSLIQAKGFAEERLVEQIKEQQRVIQCQQYELDELRFQRDIYSDETKRLRQVCRYGSFAAPAHWTGAERAAAAATPRSLHQAYAGSQPPFRWMRQIKHSGKAAVGGGPALKDSLPVAAAQRADKPFAKVPRLAGVGSAAAAAAGGGEAADSRPAPSRPKATGAKIGKVGPAAGQRDGLPASDAPPASGGGFAPPRREPTGPAEPGTGDPGPGDPSPDSPRRPDPASAGAPVPAPPRTRSPAPDEGREAPSPRERRSPFQRPEAAFDRGVCDGEDEGAEIPPTFGRGDSPRPPAPAVGRPRRAHSPPVQFEDSSPTPQPQQSPRARPPAGGRGITLGSRRLSSTRGAAEASATAGVRRLMSPRPTALTNLESRRSLSPDVASRFFD